MLRSIPQGVISIKTRQVVVESIDISFPWGYFDGSAAGDPKVCGAEGILFFSEECFISFKDGLGNGTNNYAELLGLKLLLKLALENHIIKLQVFGDSHLVINWVNGLYRMHNLLLSPLLSKVIKFSGMLDSVIFQHIYRERNYVADGFEKDGSMVREGV